MQETVQHPNRFLYVGDHLVALKLLQKKGINLCIKPTFDEALNELKIKNFDAVIINNHQDFNELSTRLKANKLPKIPVYLLSENETQDRLFYIKSNEKPDNSIIIIKREKGILNVMNRIYKDVKVRKNSIHNKLNDFHNNEIEAPYLSIKKNGNNSYTASFAFRLKRNIVDDNYSGFAAWTQQVLQLISGIDNSIRIRQIINNKQDIITSWIFEFQGENSAEIQQKYEEIFSSLSYYFNEKSLKNPVHFAIVKKDELEELSRILDNDSDENNLNNFVFKPVSKKIALRKQFNGFGSGQNTTTNGFELPLSVDNTNKTADDLFDFIASLPEISIISEIKEVNLNDDEIARLKQISGILNMEINLAQNKNDLPYLEHLNNIISAQKVYVVLNRILMDKSLKSKVLMQKINEWIFGGNAVISPSNLDLERLITMNFEQKLFFLSGLKQIANVFRMPVLINKKSGTHQILLKQETNVSKYFLDKTGVLIGQHFIGDVYLDPKQFEKHTYIIGKTGTGKTSVLNSMIMDRIQKGEGVALIDPHGDIYKKILAKIPSYRKNDVVVFEPTHPANEFGFNILKYDKNFPEQQSFIISELFKIFSEQYNMKEVGGPVFELYFTNATKLVMNVLENATLHNVSRFFYDAVERRRLLKKCITPSIIDFFNNAMKMHGEHSFEDFAPYITSKFNRITENVFLERATCRPDTDFDFDAMLSGRKILLVKLDKGRMGDEGVNMLGRLLFNRIIMAAYRRSAIPEEERTNFSLFVDEFQNFTSQDIVTALGETRKYRLQLVLANQTFAQLPDQTASQILGNVGSIITGAISPQDAQKIVPFFQPEFTVNDLVQLDNYKFIVNTMYKNNVVKPFVMESIAY